MKTIFAVIVVCILHSVYSTLYAKSKPSDTIRVRHHFLFYIGCDKFDSKYKRGVPCIALAYDSLIYFSSYKDTITVLSMQGNVLKKIHHYADMIPSHMFVDQVTGNIEMVNIDSLERKETVQAVTVNSYGNILELKKLKVGDIAAFLNQKYRVKEGAFVKLNKVYHNIEREWGDYYSSRVFKQVKAYSVSTVLHNRYIIMSRYGSSMFSDPVFRSDSNKSNNTGTLIDRIQVYDLVKKKKVVLKETYSFKSYTDSFINTCRGVKRSYDEKKVGHECRSIQNIKGEYLFVKDNRDGFFFYLSRIE